MNARRCFWLDEPSLWPVADPGEGDLYHHPARQRGTGHVDPAGRAKRPRVALKRRIMLTFWKIGRVVMNDSCERLMHSKDHSGILSRRQGSRRARRARWKKKNVA